jgi:hypothetical protein
VHGGAPFEAPTVHGGAPFEAPTVHGGAPFEAPTVHGGAHRTGNIREEEKKESISVDRTTDLFAPDGRTDKLTASSKPKARSKRAVKDSPEVDAAFAKFWIAYPRKVAKPDARKAFGQAVTSGKATAEQIIAGAMRYAAMKTGADPKYVKHPAGWLRDERWNDAPEGSPEAYAPAPRYGRNSSRPIIDELLRPLGIGGTDE